MRIKIDPFRVLAMLMLISLLTIWMAVFTIHIHDIPSQGYKGGTLIHVERRGMWKQCTYINSRFQW